MTGSLILHLLFQAVLLYDTLAWEVKMPKDIHVLRGSCLVIPCSFSYTSYPPQNPRRVVWYQWVSKGYPLVYDPLHANDVIAKFRGKTDLYGNPSYWDCSLLIKNLEQTHHGETLYAWIDPEHVGSSTYAFYDVTSTIVVDASPQQPSINIYGGEWMGETITITCSTFHTCPFSKPNIILNGTEGADQLDDEHINDGLWKITLTRTGIVQEESSTIECSVTHYGSITVTTTKSKSAQFPLNYETEKTVGLKTIGLHYLMPSLVFVLTCIIAGVIIYKRRHRQPHDYTQGSVTQIEQRRSRWNRFSRTNTCGNKPFSKPRMPSPKSEPKSCSDHDSEYNNMEDLNMYGNI
ncbi:sialic acid-binding Ig-like lectin 13 [Pseudorasbora parva]|uniref:sialic acid-binding Ig-like lectin 13 n=1 Tax=Pseudorasbora parva TaxID=51549 RepID=UPI00351F0629